MPAPDLATPARAPIGAIAVALAILALGGVGALLGLRAADGGPESIAGTAQVPGASATISLRTLNVVPIGFAGQVSENRALTMKSLDGSFVVSMGSLQTMRTIPCQMDLDEPIATVQALAQTNPRGEFAAGLTHLRTVTDIEPPTHSYLAYSAALGIGLYLVTERTGDPLPLVERFFGAVTLSGDASTLALGESGAQ